MLYFKTVAKIYHFVVKKMPEEFIAGLLFNRKPRKIVTSFFHEIAEVQLDPQEMLWHDQHPDQHGFREILVVMTGSTTQRLNDIFYHITENSLLFIDHNEKHTSGYDRESKGWHCWLILMPEGVRWSVFYRSNEGYSFLKRGYIMRSELYNALEKCWDKCCGELSEIKKAALLAELNGIVSLLLSTIGNQLTASPGKQLLKTDENARIAIKQVAAYLHNDCGCRIAEMAHMAGYSQVHFVRLFRRFMGMKPKEYIDIIRREKYKELHGQIPLKQLAEVLGFSSSSTLAHWAAKNSK